MVAKCPKCSWAMPLGGKIKRRHGAVFNCPSCKNRITYRQPLERFAALIFGFSVIAFIPMLRFQNQPILASAFAVALVSIILVGLSLEQLVASGHEE